MSRDATIRLVEVKSVDEIIDELGEALPDTPAVGRICNAARRLERPVAPDDERANPVWDLVTETCLRAWPEGKAPMSLTGPLDLIVHLIVERDDAIAEARGEPMKNPWQCGARKQGTAGGNDPADCNWPLCGCDPHADKVIETLNEGNLYVVPGDAADVMIDAAVVLDRQNGRPTLHREHYTDIYEAMVARSQKPPDDTDPACNT